MEATTVLLTTKLHSPRIDPDWIPRPRLQALLNAHPHRSLTLVVAPAGFGKTTLVSQWLAEQAELVAWLSLDAGDADPERFFAYVVAAIRAVLPAACPATFNLLHANDLPPLRRLFNTLINDLAQLPQRLILVLDDYHTMNEQPLHQDLLYLIGHLPETLHLVVTSRIDPAWSLGRLRVQGKLVELRATDLRFTREEVGQFLRHETRLDQRELAIDTLYERSEGWIAGLQLARISLQTAHDPVALVQGLRGTDRYIMEYLVDEVFACQPPAVQAFLLASAVSERFCASLCDALLDSDLSIASHELLAYLDRHNLFLIPLDNERGWYRYHHLFRDLLIHKLRLEWGEARLLRLHQRASQWFAAHALTEEAVRHALWGDQPDQAAQLILHQLHQPNPQTAGYRYVEPLLALIPEAIIQAQPALLVARAHIHYLRWELAATSACIAQAETLLAYDAVGHSEQDRMALQGNIDLLRSIVWYWQGDMPLAQEYADRALQHIPPAHAWIYGQAIFYSALAWTGAGDYEAAVRFLHERLVMFNDPTSVCRNLILVALTTINFLAGQLDRVLNTARLLATEQPQKGKIWYAWGHYFLGRAHYEQNDLVAAAAHFTQATRYPYHTNLRLVFDSLTGLALISQAQGDANQARTLFKEAQTRVAEANNIALVETATAFEARLALLQGEHEVATHKAEALDAARYCGTLPWFELVRLTLAQVRIAQGTPASLAAATTLMETCLDDAERVHNTCQVIRILVLQALARWREQNAQGALAVLASAIELATPGGFVRTFVDAGSQVAEMLKQIATDDHPHAAYISHVLAVFPQQVQVDGSRPLVSQSLSTSASHALDKHVLLTERESEIMLLLAERRSDREIADRLIISPQTVKKHKGNIYSKLDAGSRREAVARAIELGILPTEVSKTGSLS